MANIGDIVAKSGIYTEPGVVIEKKADGNVVVDTDPIKMSQYHRYTNTSGLTEIEKNKFNSVLDEIYRKEDDVEKINGIQEEIDKLRTDSTNQNIVRYLKNQQSYLIRETKKLPNVYTTEQTKVTKG